MVNLWLKLQRKIDSLLLVCNGSSYIISVNRSLEQLVFYEKSFRATSYDGYTIICLFLKSVVSYSKFCNVFQRSFLMKTMRSITKIASLSRKLIATVIHIWTCGRTNSLSTTFVFHIFSHNQ